jgi:transcriptional regulator with XRE-family HTH domain
MTNVFNVQRFAAHVRTKRGDRPLRKIAGEIGKVSASTLSRIERGAMPDIETFPLICDWLEVYAHEFLAEAPTTRMPERGALEQMAMLLRLETTLDAGIADALMVLLQRLTRT